MQYPLPLTRGVLVLRRLALLLLALAVGSPAGAHTVGISRGDYRVHDREVSATLVFARPELASAAPQVDADQDGSISPRELAIASTSLDATIVQAIDVRSASNGCSGRLLGARLTEEDGLAIEAVYRCLDGAPNTISLRFLDSLSHGHRHLATVAAGAAMQHLVGYAGNVDLTVATAHGAQANGVAGIIWPLFRLGVFHILTGYDHLIFLVGIILVGGRFRALLLVISAFTIAHSITLGLAALEIWSPSPLFVEPAIAFSIAYVGVENWFPAAADRRWMITFAFGLLHGFGFAGALREIALPAGQIPVALAAFNGGVEAGQIAVLALALPVLSSLRQRTWFGDQGIRGLSASIACVGAWLFVSRVV